MSGLIESASSILASSERRVEASALNVSNASTPGYKRQVAFTSALKQAASAIGPRVARTGAAADSELHFTTDFSQGALRETGSPLDLAIYGPGLIQLRDGDVYVYSRGGSFTVGPEGVVADPAGRRLQQAGGGDLTVSNPTPEILGDGTVIENGLPVSTIALLEPAAPERVTTLGGGIFTAPDSAMEQASDSILHQGQLESANVTMSDEMIAMMSATRQAEGGARLVQFYDQLIGQAITTFSRSSK
ncbi:hypothetical protein MB02_14360 [Croceicoccus estronivorus]|uniref:flagellar hook-basal body complex protein n=1 Tax=Croceicoccus estronivorus TaxID=1172626 RepID=UPI0008314658|nr:flagellar hook basal-body protein [Croceicoccus estronivorus]OCC22945.1 hypothetical protein MB02_14360 [Croceicoccus estronivorus]